MVTKARGCLACSVYEDRIDTGAILVLEQWQSMDDMCRHIESELFRRVLTAMEFAKKAPEVFFHEVSKTTGLETVEAIRLGKPGSV